MRGCCRLCGQTSGLLPDARNDIIELSDTFLLSYTVYLARRYRLLTKRNGLVTFLAVADLGSVHAAARSLNVTQPAVTRQIHRLEHELGVALFTRGVAGMRLNDSGKQFRAYVEEIVANAREGAAEISDAVEGRTGRLHLGAGPAWVHEIVPQVLADLYRVCPAVSVELVSRISDYYRMLAEGELDMLAAEIPQGGHDPGIVYETLITIDRFVFAGADHPLAGRARLRPRDLHDFPWVAFKDSIYGPIAMASYFAPAGLPAPEPTVSTTSMQTGIRMLRKSNYLMLLPGTLGASLERIGVRPLRTAGRFRSYEAGLMYPRWVLRLRPHSTFRRLLIEHLSKRFKQEPPPRPPRP